jgi:hypothetical protein
VTEEEEEEWRQMSPEGRSETKRKQRKERNLTQGDVSQFRVVLKEKVEQASSSDHSLQSTYGSSWGGRWEE